MIRKFEIKDLDIVLELWLNTNIKAHSFISEKYWIGNFESVKSMLPESQIYVYDMDGKIEGFVGLDNGYIAGIFINENMQSKGIGKKLLDKCKSEYSKLTLNVYEKNIRAIQFYEREGFCINEKDIDKNTNEIELNMVWSKQNNF